MIRGLLSGLLTLVFWGVASAQAPDASSAQLPGGNATSSTASSAQLPGGNATASSAQLPGGNATASSAQLPGGNATLRGAVAHRLGQARISAVSIVVYALRPDGTPAVSGTTTDENGEFRFENVSNDPGISYLVGAHYRGVPFGEPARFEAGQSELEVVIEVSDPTADPAALRVSQTRVRIEWLGAHLEVSETHALQNDSDEVIYLPPGQRAEAEPIFEASLPDGALEFTPGPGDSLEQRGNRILYWGPVYPGSPGSQELAYRYRLAPIAGAGGAVAADRVSLRRSFPSGTGELSLLVPENVLEVRADPLAEDSRLELEGRGYRVFTGRDLAPGDVVEIELSLPARRSGSEALELVRTDAWLELDATSLSVTLEHQLTVDDGPPLVGTLEDPLLQLRLPTGAELTGVSDLAQPLGLRVADGGLALLGPIGPGEHQVAYSYRVPVHDQAAEVELSMSKALPVLNVLVADTGVAIESDRLHRRRPFRSGTRIYLHREAYRLAPNEPVSFRVTPLRQRAIPRRASLFLILAAAGFAAWFLIGPTLRAGDFEADVADTSPLTRERETVTQSILDLDNDFETGKVSADDHARMRAELRARALELLRQERETPARAAERAAARATEPEQRFCTSCGVRVDPAWQFCAGCGAKIDVGAESAG